ncbi:UbiX family flavin prenyltransferase [Dactylosporangium sp. CA-092794]|uniref:UbiX family flavin prenyltransferase n=1 Tax=Dactylosporangium sp. CA-092794 TaxID=3239929 RepID=UPI003D8D2135
MRRVVVGISGASGAAYGVHLLDVLRSAPDVETHAIVSPGAERTLRHELDLSASAVEQMATRRHHDADVGAAVASGTYPVHAMVVAPCSIRTLGAIASCQADSLITRAADVCLKERRRLVLVVRETPLHLGHLRLMTAVTEAGAVIMPPVPAWYARPRAVADIVEHTVLKICDLIGVDTDIAPRWTGLDPDPSCDQPADRRNP